MPIDMEEYTKDVDLLGWRWRDHSHTEETRLKSAARAMACVRLLLSTQRRGAVLRWQIANNKPCHEA